MRDSFQVVRDFEEYMAAYCGSAYAVAVDSCTNAIFLSCQFQARQYGADRPVISIPARTYISVPQAVIHAGFEVELVDKSWYDVGAYRLTPINVIDSSKRVSRNVYGIWSDNPLVCLSFHAKKHIPIGKGGMILTNNHIAYQWLKMARYEGRSEVPYGEDNPSIMGWNMYMTPEQAARGLLLASNLPDYPLILSENYPDLRNFDVFKNDPRVHNGNS